VTNSRFEDPRFRTRVVAWRRANSTGPKLAGRRLNGEAINGRMIDDAYIYRVT
jgi:hypothetical protein